MLTLKEISLLNPATRMTPVGTVQTVSDLADWIREATKMRRERWMEAAREEGYKKGYADAQQGKPPQLPPQDNSNGMNGSVRDS